VHKPKQKPKPPQKMTKAEQSERFKETARELGVDETGAEFERLSATVSRAAARAQSTRRKGDT
jgi:hypothetical protein